MLNKLLEIKSIW